MGLSTRIIFNNSNTGGYHLAHAASLIVAAKQEIALAKSLADAVSAGGVTPANLEGSAEFGAVVGGGAVLYTEIANLSSNLNTVTDASLAALFQG